MAVIVRLRSVPVKAAHGSGRLLGLRYRWTHWGRLNRSRRPS